MWVKKKLDPKYINMVLIPAYLLWFTVTVALIWYEIVIIPVFFVDMAKSMNVVTGVVVGAINLFMLILSFIMLFAFRKSWKTAEFAKDY